jgi:hypothetical protein
MTNWTQSLASIIPPDLGAQLQETMLSVTSGLTLLVVAGLIGVAGWLVALLLGRATQMLIGMTGVDGSAARLAPAQLARPEMLPSRLMGYAVFWVAFLCACIVALRVVGLDLAPSIAARLQDVVPRVVTSALVLILGIPIALAASRILNAILAPTGVRPGRIRSQAVVALLIGFTALIALEQLGIAATLVMAIGVTVVATAGLALALAFGLGCRELARDLIVEYLRASDEGAPKRSP